MTHSYARWLNKFKETLTILMTSKSNSQSYFQFHNYRDFSMSNIMSNPTAVKKLDIFFIRNEKKLTFFFFVKFVKVKIPSTII